MNSRPLRPLYCSAVMRSALRVFLCLLLSVPLSEAAHASAPNAGSRYQATFAYFPLAVPAAVLGQVIKRDRILLNNLHKMGVDIVFKPFAKGSDTMALIRENRIDAVAFGDMPTIEACIVGNMLILGLAKQGYSAVVAKQGSIMRDLRRARIGNATASTGHYALMQALETAGIHEQQVTIVPMNLHEMPDALAVGAIDAFAAWEPVPTATLKRYPNRFSIVHRQVSLVYFLVSQQLAERQPAAARELTAALVRAIAWLKKSDANLTKAATWTLNEMAAFGGSAPQLKPHEVARITHVELLDVPGIPLLPKSEGGNETLLSQEFSFMKKLGKLPADAGWDRIRSSIRRDLLHEVLAAQARYATNRFNYAP